MYEAAKRGYGVLIPCGDFSKYDIVVDRNGKLERVQVKAVTPKNGAIEVHTKSMVFDKELDGNNRNKQVKYVDGDFDWLAVYDLHHHEVYFIPAVEVFGRSAITLRLDPPTRKSSKIRMAAAYTEW